MGNIHNMQGSGFGYQGMNNPVLQQNHALIMQQQQQLITSATTTCFDGKLV